MNYKTKYCKYKNLYLQTKSNQLKCILFNPNMVGGNLTKLHADLVNLSKSIITDHILINDITSFYQIDLPIDENILNKKRVKRRFLTLIGEYHKPLSASTSASSLPDSINVSKYISSIISLNKISGSNKNTYLFLEYNPSLHALDSIVLSLNSMNIKNTIDELKANKLTNYIYGIDVRELTNMMGRLYAPIVYDEKLADIKKIYIDPLNTLLNTSSFEILNEPTYQEIKNDKNLQEYISKHKGGPNIYYTRKNREYLQRMKTDIEGDITIISNMLPEITKAVTSDPNITVIQFLDIIFRQNNPDLKNLFFKNVNGDIYDTITILRNLYKKMVDFFILKLLFRKDYEIYHFILLVGEEHAQNIYNIFKSGGNVLFEKTNTVNQCIDIKGSFIFR